jgi:glycerophosphoryl diester phosphodiesterase
MQVLAHRGWWTNAGEKNSIGAFRRALAGGFGVETDLRDREGAVVVAHDPPGPLAPEGRALLALHRQARPDSCLALNAKADGLAPLLRSLIDEFAVADYFCFDMSVPETLAYRRSGLRYFTRESEFEPQPALYAEADGVWMDMFESDWIRAEHIERHLRSGKRVALVSPELHRRPPEGFWAALKASGLGADDRLMLCTDRPDRARDFFDD